jgi:uncharacterized membrane protein YjjB (DUF3815 family)
MMEYLLILLKTIAGGVAALGFAILFNVTKRTLLFIFGLGAVAILIKLVFIQLGFNLIISSFAAASTVGILSQAGALWKKTPPLVIAIPSVIPMVPGIFIYKMMLGFIQLATVTEESAFNIDMMNTIENGTKALFILLSLSLGVGIPYILHRKNAIDYFRFSRK